MEEMEVLGTAALPLLSTERWYFGGSLIGSMLASVPDTGHRGEAGPSPVDWDLDYSHCGSWSRGYWQSVHPAPESAFLQKTHERVGAPVWELVGRM